MSICVCIDGTGSKKWSEDMKHASHVRQIYSLHPGIENIDKIYLNGPNLFGTNTWWIIRRAISFIGKHLDLPTGSPLQNPATQPEIDLIGYSRGAAIALELARRMQTQNTPIRFLGLFDAVARDVMLSGVRIVPSNVLHCAHALRHSNRGSREPFVTRDILRSPIRRLMLKNVLKIATTLPPHSQRRWYHSIPLPIGFEQVAFTAEPSVRFARNFYLATHGAMGGVHDAFADFDPQSVAFRESILRDIGQDTDEDEGACAYEFVLSEAVKAGMFRGSALSSEVPLDLDGAGHGEAGR